MADEKQKQAAPRARSDEERSSVGAPLSVTGAEYKTPGPDVPNSEIDPMAVSLDSACSEVVENKDPNPLELRPAPGPSAVEVLGVPKGE